ncbi:MAG: nucleotide exchange factor GrpE [Epsilonproteobacteria bacterium]|nr:nucleotide exchange factor GrpE [Campylobacterota bacterium]
MGKEKADSIDDGVVKSDVNQENSEIITEDNSAMIAQIEELKASVNSWQDKYLRACADFENSKRLLVKDKISAVGYANEAFAKDILAVADSFESALYTIENVDISEGEEVLAKIKEGLHLTFEQLKKVLEKNHIIEVASKKKFDPNVHQAIMQVESEEHESGDVVMVMQKGYMLKDRILRPSMVSICK